MLSLRSSVSMRTNDMSTPLCGEGMLPGRRTASEPPPHHGSYDRHDPPIRPAQADYLCSYEISPDG
jgi:hypothetical protein